jgi:hypothetical protein
VKGDLPEALLRWRLDRGRLVPRREAAAPPAAGELLLVVEGCLLDGAELSALGEGACPGGAAVGRVVAAADDVADWVGHRALSCEVLPCGQCSVCLRGRGPACPSAVRPGQTRPGALASHVQLPARYLLRLEDPLAVPSVEPWRLAAVAGPAARVYHAFCRVGFGPGDLALFLGETSEARFGGLLARAKAGSALALPLPPEESPELERTRTAIRDLAPRSIHVFETTGTALGLSVALVLVDGGGSLTFLAREGVELLLSPRLLEVPLLLAGPPHPDLLVELLALVARGELGLVDLTTRVLPAELDAAHRSLLRGTAPPCSILTPS